MRYVRNKKSTSQKVVQGGTLHIGATRTAPFQELGCLRCIFRATAPPIDSPNRKLGRPRKSGFSAPKV